MSFIPLLSIVCVFSAINALPVSVLPVRPYVFLAPELPKFQLKPTQFKIQADPSGIKSDVPKQYVLVYPNYQYLTTRQNENSGFFETIQNYFINFGNSQMDETSAVMDPVEADKPQAIEAAPAPTTAPPATAAAAPDAIKSIFAADLEKQGDNKKFFYSYITPASTVPLNADRRFYFLSEQPQIYGSFSGPSVNPVFNLQPVPVVLQSRSNVAQVPDEPQPGQVVSENVQKFSQIPPVMTAVEQPKVKQISDQIDSVVDSAENRVAPVIVNDRALPVSTELPIEVVPTVPAVIEARNNPIPIEIVKEPVLQVIPEEKSAIIDSVQTPVDVALKDAPSVVVVNEPIVAAVIDQNVQNSEKVEAVTQSVL